MSAANFEAVMAEVLAHEGGYVNHPSDPGGETNFGISKRSYPREDIKGMTRSRAIEIYRRDFWGPVRGDELPGGLDYLTVDAAINSGPSRAAKWLQMSLGVKADGAIGPVTLAAIRSAELPRTIIAATAMRLDYLRNLRTWPTFGRGWTARVDRVRAVALDMAAVVAPAPPADDASVIFAWLARRPDNWRAVVEWLGEMQ